METIEDKLYVRATSYCAKAEHCESEVMEKLTLWKGKETADLQSVVSRLRDNNFLSDERYCSAYVRDKFRFNHWGKIKIRTMLHAKRLSEAAIETALEEEIDEAEYLETLKKLVNEKLRSLKSDDPHLFEKVYRFVAGRGFDYDSFRKVMNAK